MLHKNLTKKKKKFLPYKNLSELYKESIFGQPAINLFPVVENGTILIQRDDNKDTEEYEVDTDTLNNIDVILHRKTLIPRIQEAISTRGSIDPAVMRAGNWLIQAIMGLGSVAEITDFVEKYKNPEVGFINIEELIPGQAMQRPLPVTNFIEDKFAAKLFTRLFKEYRGKPDAGPGEDALTLLSSKIDYGMPGDIVIQGVGKVEIKASASGSGKGGRIGDTHINQDEMVRLLTALEPGRASFTVMQGTKPFFGGPEKGREFIMAACNAWFGAQIPEIIESFGSPNFRVVWQKMLFDQYKSEGGWVGMLLLGVKTYQYVITGEDFALYAKKSNQGNLCDANSKQTSRLGPQVEIY
jgi:hypothetical protein